MPISWLELSSLATCPHPGIASCRKWGSILESAGHLWPESSWGFVLVLRYRLLPWPYAQDSLLKSQLHLSQLVGLDMVASQCLDLLTYKMKVMVKTMKALLRNLKVRCLDLPDGKSGQSEFMLL